MGEVPSASQSGTTCSQGAGAADGDLASIAGLYEEYGQGSGLVLLRSPGGLREGCGHLSFIEMMQAVIKPLSPGLGASCGSLASLVTLGDRWAPTCGPG